MRTAGEPVGYFDFAVNGECAELDGGGFSTMQKRIDLDAWFARC